MTRNALLVHGLSSDSESWWRVAAALEKDGWDVATVDLRGHGFGARAESYALTDYARDLDDGWDLVIGHSLGGAVSVLAAQRPRFTKALVLLDPVLDVPVDQAEPIMAEQVAELSFTKESLARDKPHWHKKDRASKLAGIQRVDPHVVTRTFTATGRWDVTTEARDLTIPTLILSGDPAVYTMLDPELARSLPVDYVVIEGAGHSPHRDRPEQTLEAIRSFLKERVGRP